MTKGILDSYKHRIKAKDLHEDELQELGVLSLQRLHEELVAAQACEKRTFFEKLTGMGAGNLETPQGVYLYGGVGRGKSMLMDLFYQNLPKQIRARRVHFHAFMIEVHEYIHSRRMDDGMYDEVDAVLPSLAERIAEHSRVLCFDEFHVTDIADAMILGRLFTALFDRDVVVVATSNWAPEDLYKDGLQRARFMPFIDLLKARLEVIHLDGALDYRGQFMQEEGCYFYPLGRTNLEKIETLFHKITGKTSASAAKLEVKGRTIDIKAACKGIARFSFDELCRKPLGAEDYLKIAQEYKTIFLESVPKLKKDERNEAKRLMVLIDALYENKTKLVVSADAPPEGIYTGKDHGFEFERTVSRLKEMQSKEYLQKENNS